jgi:predicted GH43/DUF377 family glycosyl hydrolase
MITNLSELGRIKQFRSDNNLWASYNPSIAYDGDGKLRVAIRACNYTIRANGHFTLTTPTIPYAVTRVFYGFLNPDILEISGVVEPIFSDDTPAQTLRCGLEDARLFWRKDGMHLVGAEVETDNKPGPQPNSSPIMQAEYLYDELTNTLRYLRSIPSPNGRSVEKNWSPTNVPTGDFQFAYSLTQVWQNGQVVGEPIDKDKFHGGTQLVHQEDGTWLDMVHMVQRFEYEGDSYPNRRTYIHYFVQRDKNGRVIKMSMPLTLTNSIVEFASGMVEHGDDLIISFGINDNTCGFLRIPKKVVLDLLQYSV